MSCVLLRLYSKKRNMEFSCKEWLSSSKALSSALVGDTEKRLTANFSNGFSEPRGPIHSCNPPPPPPHPSPILSPDLFLPILSYLLLFFANIHPASSFVLNFWTLLHHSPHRGSLTSKVPSEIIMLGKENECESWGGFQLCFPLLSEEEWISIIRPDDLSKGWEIECRERESNCFLSRNICEPWMENVTLPAGRCWVYPKLWTSCMLHY